MEIRKIYSAVAGIAQTFIGLSSGILMFLFGFEIIELQNMLNVSPELLPIILLVLGLFSFFSLINGFFLIRDWQK